MIEQLLTSPGDSVHIQIQEICQQTISAMTQFDRFQAGVKTALLLVEQAIEEQDGGFEFIRRNLQSTRIGNNRNRLCSCCCPQLPAVERRIGRRVQVPPADFGAAEAAALDQLAQRVVYFHVQCIGEIIGKEPSRRTSDENLRGRQ